MGNGCGRLGTAALAIVLAMGLALDAATPAAMAQKVSFKDSKDEHNGPGKYTYPTDPVYKPGSFDMTGFTLKAHGDKVDLDVEMAAKLDDPWKTGSGFSVQMVFIFVQTRAEKQAAAGKPEAAKAGAGKQKNGFTQGLPGLQIQFAPDDAWDRCIVLSPEPASRVRAEVEAKAAAMKDAIVIPARVKGSGRAISATIDRKALGSGDPTDWGYQVVIASSDAYPAADSLLVRKVAETESQHRFGGGSDGACGPNVLDVLAGDGQGEAGEVAKQHEMLQYECNPDSTPRKLATLKMIHVDKD